MSPATTREHTRVPLTRDRVIDGALALADEIGIDALTIRKLAESLGVKPMTIYHHVENKDAIVDAIVDRVFAEITLPDAAEDWRSAVRDRCRSARQVLGRHPWAIPLMESRTTPGPATLAHHDAMLGFLFAGGLPIEVVAHAYAILDSYVYGFALQEAALPFNTDDDISELAGSMVAAMPEGSYPHLVEFTMRQVLQPGYRFADSFDVGLEIIISGLDRMTKGPDPQ